MGMPSWCIAQPKPDRQYAICHAWHDHWSCQGHQYRSLYTLVFYISNATWSCHAWYVAHCLSSCDCATHASCHITTLQRQNAENLKQIFPEKEYRGLSPNFHIHVSVNELYILTMGLPFLLEEICGLILGIYKSLTDTWMLGWGRAIPRKGIYKRNCSCSAWQTHLPDATADDTSLSAIATQYWRELCREACWDSDYYSLWHPAS